MSIGLPCDRCGDIEIAGSSGYHPFLQKHGCADLPNQPLGWTQQEQVTYHAEMTKMAYSFYGVGRKPESTAYLLREADLILHSRSQAEWWQAVVTQREAWPEWHTHLKAIR